MWSSSYNDKRRSPDILSSLSKLTEFLFGISFFWSRLCSFTVRRGKLRQSSFREAHREIFKIRTIELSLEMLMTELNIWISNNANTYHFDQTRNTRQVAWQKWFCDLSRLWKRSHFVLFNPLKLKKHDKKRNKGKHEIRHVTLEFAAVKKEKY